MKKKRAAIQHAEQFPSRNVYELRLFISGASPLSARAIENLKAICNEHLLGCHTLEIIDVRQHPEVAGQEQLVVLPLLLKKAPLPERRLIGDLADTNKVLSALGLI